LISPKNLLTHIRTLRSSLVSSNDRIPSVIWLGPSAFSIDFLSLVKCRIFSEWQEGWNQSSRERYAHSLVSSAFHNRSLSVQNTYSVDFEIQKSFFKVVNIFKMAALYLKFLFFAKSNKSPIEVVVRFDGRSALQRALSLQVVPQKVQPSCNILQKTLIVSQTSNSLL
jgi:hypothetical protein